MLQKAIEFAPLEHCKQQQTASWSTKNSPFVKSCSISTHNLECGVAEMKTSSLQKFEWRLFFFQFKLRSPKARP